MFRSYPNEPRDIFLSIAFAIAVFVLSKEILRRGNFIIAATTDGYMCYGTRTPLAASCHKAVPEVFYAGE
jgi:hypothetical protein